MHSILYKYFVKKNRYRSIDQQYLNHTVQNVVENSMYFPKLYYY